MRRVWRNDNHIARPDFAAGAPDDPCTFHAGSGKDSDGFIVGRTVFGIFNGAAGHQRPVAGNDVIHLGNLAVLRPADALLLRLGAVNYTDADIVVAVYIDDADLLIADGCAGIVARDAHDFRIG